MSKIDELEALANAATPGPWTCGEDNDGWYVDNDDIQLVYGVKEDNATFIAAANPETVKRLITLVRLQQNALRHTWDGRDDEVIQAIKAFEEFNQGEKK